MLKLPKLVELAFPPQLETIKQSTAALPNGVDLNEIILKLEDVNNLEYLRYSQRLLRSTPSFIRDCFWYIFLDQFGKNPKFGYELEKLKKTKVHLKDSISTKFLDLILKSESTGSFRAAGHKCFFNQLYKLLALIVYSIFCHAWPDSWRRFVCDDFRQYLIDRFSLWIEGIKHIPGEGEDDHLWNCVEPEHLRNNDADPYSSNNTNKNNLPFYLQKTIGIVKQDDENPYKRARRGGRLRHLKSLWTAQISLPDQKCMQFEASKFDVNGCSPLIESQIKTQKAEWLVSRRDVVGKKYWKINPLDKNRIPK